MTNQASAAAARHSPDPSRASSSLAEDLVDAYRAVRDETERRAVPLSPEDQQIQSMPDASPAKWHRAHTTWFFEQFLLTEHCPGYKAFHPDYAFLFNSYYVSAGPRHARAERGLVTRPGAEEIGELKLRSAKADRDRILFILGCAALIGGVVPASTVRWAAESMAIKALELTDAWAVRELTICVKNFDDLPSYAQQLVVHMRASAE